MIAQADEQTILKYLTAVEGALQIQLSSEWELEQIAIQVTALSRKYQ